MDLEKKDMYNVAYALTMSSLMQAQVCTRHNLVFIIGILGRYLSNPGMPHKIAVKCVMISE